MKKLSFLFIFFLVLLSSISVKAEQTLACTPVKITTQNKAFILPGPTQKNSSFLYFIHNISQQGIWIDHPVSRPSASAGWSSYIQSQHWAALSVTKKFAITCLAIHPGAVETLQCEQVITLCSPSVSPTEMKRGTFWVAEDLTWEALLKKVKKRGFVIQ